MCGAGWLGCSDGSRGEPRAGRFETKNVRNCSSDVVVSELEVNLADVGGSEGVCGAPGACTARASGGQIQGSEIEVVFV